MVKKKAKASKSAKKRELWQMEDVQVHTGLPPQVEGQLRCFCRMTIGQILWLSPSPPDVTHVRIKWWGEDGDGSIFRPVNANKKSTTASKTVARYPVRSGPKQFASYLNDMSSLVLEILSGPSKIPIGHAEVPQIGLLSPARPINGFYPVFTHQEEKVGEIHVSLVLESLMASYDSMGSIPTTDISMETHTTQESMYPQQGQPVPHSQAPTKPEIDPFISPASRQNGDLKFGETAADLRQQLNYSGHEKSERQRSPVRAGSTVAITTNGDVVTTSFNNDRNHVIGNIPQSNQVAGSDLLSVLLNKGNKLREEMVLSSMNSYGQTSVKEIYSEDTPVNGVNPADISGMPQRRGSTGSLLKEILKADQEAGIGGSSGVDVSRLDDKAVDLVFGDTGPFDLQMLKMTNGSPGSSISEVDIISEPGDPVHSQSILQELFYKNLESDVSTLSELSADEGIPKKIIKTKNDNTSKSVASLDDDANMRPPSRSSSVSSLTFPEPEPEKDKENIKKKSKVPKRKARSKVKRKGSKKRRGSRSSISEASDSDVGSVGRSETSQVSFDMPPSDIDEPVQDNPRRKSSSTDGLSVERLTLLGRVHVARVTISELQLAGQDLDSSMSKKKGKVKTVGKPPKPSPKAKKAMTYFVEYQFPVVATSRDKYSPNAMATEVMRVASKSVKDGAVTFNHRSVFPVMFDGSAVEKWWKSALVFKIYSRSAGQKVPSLAGSCGIPLKSILKSESLHVDKGLEIRESANKNTSINSSLRQTDDGLVGNLKISIELASDSRDFSLALARTKLAEMSGKAKIVPIPQPPPPSRPPLPQEFTTAASNTHHNSQVLQTQTHSTRRNTEIQTNDLDSHSTQTEPVSVEYSHSLPHGAPFTQQLPPPYSMPVQQNFPDTAEMMTLHTILMIPEGRNISLHGIPSLVSAKRHPIFPHQPHSYVSQGPHTRDTSTRNTYVVCRMFWCNDAVTSNVSWGSLAPLFNFIQIAPVLVSQSLLERMRNNFMVVEVWDKKTTAESDKLVGIVKLSLHQFYMSFRDKKIASALLKSQFPVISIDNFLPIVDPLTGSQYGQLKVLLAMGSAEQVDRLQRLKADDVSGSQVPERPQHYLERNDVYKQDNANVSLMGTECVVEHLFEIIVEGIRGLAMFENMMWGEADCFIQYHFPTQPQSQSAGSPVKQMITSMKSFRSATTLCIPDPTFNDITRHRIVLSQGTPVQRELLTACAGSGGGSGGVPFEVWCRYYHPNVRDQCIAKSSLPLAKLCAMVTMQKRGEASVQTFALPLTQVLTDADNFDPEKKAKMKESGLMDVTIHYKTQIIQNESNPAVSRNLSGAQVCISVGVIRASGLKSAAETIAHLDSGMQYPAEVGVNAYAKVKLSFLGKGEERITRTIARSFTPEFSHHMDFPCPLLWTEADNDALSLAEILESAEIVIEVWHQVPGLSSDLDCQIANEEIHARKLVNKTSDVLLGSTTQSLSSLLTHRTGINGWFPINLPSLGWQKDESNVDVSGEDVESPSMKGLERVVGGLELSVKFAHHDNRERVIHAARGVGWSPVELDVEQDEDWESEDESSSKHYKITVCVDQISFPVQNALKTGQSTLDKTAKCYIRYKLYDKASVISKPAKMNINQAGYIMTNFNHSHSFQIPSSSPFKWYLREERLEMQIWVSYGNKADSEARPQHRDKLIGTGYISLETLGDQRRKQHRISGIYPLFKPGASSLGGAYVRAHITSKPTIGAIEKMDNEDEVSNSERSDEDTEYDPNDSFHQLTVKRATKTSPNKSQIGPIMEEVASSFTVVISIERALHLPHICEKNRSEESLPNTYVSYQTAECMSPAHTIVFHNSDDPVWDHQHETKLSTELLYEENKNLVFKVWHKPHNAPQDPDKSSDRVLGFVSVDLTPLSSGMQQICGWYNIVDFNGQCKGQIKVSVMPQECVTRYRQGIAAAASIPSEPISLPVGVSNHEHHPLFFADQPMSLPVDPCPFTSQLPQFDTQYSSMQQQHDMLQQQLSQNIRQFLNQQQANLDSINNVDREPSLHWNPAMQNNNTNAREPSMHWTPDFTDLKFDDKNAASRSVLFSSLRKNLQDLDDITNKLKCKLYVGPTELEKVPNNVNQVDVACSTPIPMGSGEMTLTSTHSALSTISSLQFTHRSARINESEVQLTGSNEVESSHTAVDSGAFSVTHSSEKYQDIDPPDSQRSCDRIDTFRMGMTPRDLAHTGPLDSERSTFHYGSTPRSAQNNSTTSDLGQYDTTPRDTQNYSNNSEMGQTRDTPWDEDRVPNTLEQGLISETKNSELHLSPRDLTIGTGLNSANSDEVSLGFSFSGEMSHRSHGELSHRSHGELSHRSHNVGGGSSNNGHTEYHKKDMSIIQENNEDSDVEGGEYYHRYRDLLDEEENDENTDIENDEGDIIHPRTINDVSCKFGGPVMATNISALRPHTPPKQNGSEDHTMPFDVLGSGSRGTKSSTPDTKNTVSDKEDLSDHEENVPNQNFTKQMPLSRKHFFEERDSWISDSEGENEEIHKDLEQLDINEGPSQVSGMTMVSPRENKDDPEDWDRDDVHETDNAKAARMRKNLLSNVELESSSSGSVIHRQDSERDSRMSSAGSRRTHRTLSEQSSGSQRNEEIKQQIVKEEEDIETFFNSADKISKEVPVVSDETSDSRSSSPFIGKNEIPVFMQNGNGLDSEDECDETEQQMKHSELTEKRKHDQMTGVPNFFIPKQHMEESMKALYLATATHHNTSQATEQAHDPERVKGKIEATSDMAEKLTRAKGRFTQKTNKGRQIPTADEAKRIAKIFSQKYT